MSGTTGIVDATNPARQLKVNSDGSINTNAAISAAGDVGVSGTINSASGAGSTLVLDLGSGQSSWGFQITAGTFSSGTTLVFEGSDESGTPSNWNALVGYDVTTGAPDPAPITSISGAQTLPLTIRGPAAGYEHIQVRCSSLHAGDTLTGRLIGSTAAFGTAGAINVPDGADVTQGTSTDANTANTVIGRLTKIRDLLLATLTVAGTITANLDATNSTHLANIDTATADLVADLDTLITNTGRIPASPAQEAGNLLSIKNDLDTLVTNTGDLLADGDQLATINTNTANIGASADAAVVGDNAGSLSAKLRGLTKIFNDIWDSTNHLFHMNNKQIGGTAISVNAGTVDAGTQRVSLATDQKVPTKAASGDFADGAINTLGAQADAAYTDGTGAASGTSQGLFKGMFVKLAAIATSVAGVLQVKRAAVAVYSLASGAITATGNSGDLTVGLYTEIGIDINITAESGTTPTIQFFWNRKGADGIYYPLWQTKVIPGTDTLPEKFTASIGAGMNYNEHLGLTGQLSWTVAGTTPSFTLSANVYGK